MWAGLHLWGGPRGLIRVTASKFAVDDLGMRFDFTSGFYSGSGAALAVHSHVSCLLEVLPLENHFGFFSFNAVRDPLAMVLDGLLTAVGPDGTPAAGPIVMFRIDADGAPVPDSVDALQPALRALNQSIEQEFARNGDAFAGARELAPVDLLRRLFPKANASIEEGRLAHGLRADAGNTLSAGRVLFGGSQYNASARCRTTCAARSALRFLRSGR